MPTDFAAVRRQEFTRLERTRTIYADYTGAALFPESLVTRHLQGLTAAVLGNPHSESAPSLASTAAIAQAKRRTLDFLGADPGQYEVVFTANASGALRILAEAFPFAPGGRLVLTADNHNSVNGLRRSAGAQGGEVEYVPLRPDLTSEDPLPALRPAARPSLFAYPAQSNFSGVRHPLSWVGAAQAAGYHVLLDAAAYLPTHALSLEEHPADFVVLSFYKLFGYPTGVGALVARREALARLRRKYFAGGTVELASVQNALERAKPGAEAFEDGTPDFLAMSAICDGLAWLEALGMAEVERHSTALVERFLAGLRALGEQVAVYGPGPDAARGSTVAFNLLRGARVLPFEEVEAAARAQGIAIRGGCFCNPGAAESALRIPADWARRCFGERDVSLPRRRECLGGGAVGALRASFGVANDTSDVDGLLTFLCWLLEREGTSRTRAGT